MTTDLEMKSRTMAKLMKRLFVTLALAWSPTLQAGFLDAFLAKQGDANIAQHHLAIVAYERGDYERAFKEWRPLAERGDAPTGRRIGRRSPGCTGTALIPVRSRRLPQ